MSTRDTEACAEMQTLLAERASGPLEDGDAAVLDGHLRTCARCEAAASQWETLFSLVAVPAPMLKEEAALRGLSERTLAAWQYREQRRRRMPGVVAGAGSLLAAAAALLVFFHAPVRSTTGVAAPVAPLSESVASAQLDWTDGPTWEMDEVETSDASPEDAALLDGLSLEGDGAFGLGDNG